MSTRYVWGRFNFSPEYKLSDDYCPVGRQEDGGTLLVNGPMSLTTSPLYKATSLTMDYSDNRGAGAAINNRSPSHINMQYGNETIPAGTYFKFRSPYATEGDNLSPIYYAETSCNIRGQTYELYGNDYKGIFLYSGNAKEVIPYTQKGSKVSDVSGTSQSTYPDDGVQGSYWYTYQGQDNIDPSACSIPSTINGGTAIKITVTPGTGKVYGGTVSYQYQVKLGSGAWTTIATTSATSRSYTVPYGTASIQVRVRAKDNIGFTSSTYVTSSRVNVINNQPPTAPGSIDVTNVVAGQQATITLTAATDPDGTIASYIYERSVDGSAWTQIANVNSLTQTDTISADWGTVAYRACAVDDDGASGPYVTSSTTVVNSGWVIISGPAADMGSQPKPFTFTITPSISGTTTSDQITVDVTLDGSSIYNEAVAPGTAIDLDVDTRLMRTGDHAIAVSATCASYVPAADEYTFTVPAITTPDGGRMDQLEGPDGEVIFPVTIARAVAGLENVGVESKVHPGAYTGSGTYGSGNPNSLALEFEPKLVIIQGTSGRMAVLIKPSGVGISIGASNSTTLNVIWDGESVSWYNAVNASNQMNTSNETYSYTAFG